jgi:hypothetical protein
MIYYQIEHWCDAPGCSIVFCEEKKHWPVRTEAMFPTIPDNWTAINNRIYCPEHKMTFENRDGSTFSLQ